MMSSKTLFILALLLLILSLRVAYSIDEATFQRQQEQKMYNFEKWQKDKERKKQEDEKNWQKVNIQKKTKATKSTTWQGNSAQTNMHLTCTKCGARLYVTSKDDPSVVSGWEVYHNCKEDGKKGVKNEKR